MYCYTFLSYFSASVDVTPVATESVEVFVGSVTLSQMDTSSLQSCGVQTYLPLTPAATDFTFDCNPVIYAEGIYVEFDTTSMGSAVICEVTLTGMH